MARPAAPGLKERLLRWMGLWPEAPDPSEWVPVFSAAIDDTTTGFSEQAARVQQALTDAGIDAHQQPYVPPARGFFTSVGRSANERIEVAVMIRHRDRPRAEQVLAARNAAGA